MREIMIVSTAVLCTLVVAPVRVIAGPVILRGEQGVWEAANGNESDPNNSLSDGGSSFYFAHGSGRVHRSRTAVSGSYATVSPQTQVGNPYVHQDAKAVGASFGLPSIASANAGADGSWVVPLNGSTSVIERLDSPLNAYLYSNFSLTNISAGPTPYVSSGPGQDQPLSPAFDTAAGPSRIPAIPAPAPLLLVAIGAALATRFRRYRAGT